ncbi:FAD linked oxidase domain protein [Phocaeicola salanitronis DSM 18170]|uniref:UDP-N-acetylenolpyruvoylglucosamine reductase n=1 Tax=Phocaeicola salanitronis (strain DSM 18170 / JCM 13657 / CCUG 60908 / BL78) TaxID=667015 RepID=F0R0E1_PHOSB|nr:FAD-binding protein [Phocaeicola salanitronis]ADY37285.1 FAD linked oxidase domain protein [Phocaeicola salanitronis DSM 18170]
MQQKLGKIGIIYKKDIPMSQLTGMNQVDIIPLVVYPSSLQQMTDLCNILIEYGLTWEILGGLTNTYLCESFKRDVVISTRKLNRIHQLDGILTVECGCNLTSVSKHLVEQGCIGYEGLVGIPGTVGAATINNSGAFGCEMGKVVKGIQCLSMRNGQLKYFSNDELQYEKRNSILKGSKEYCVLSIDLNTSHKSNIEDLTALMRKNLEMRRIKVDGRRKSLGTVFVATSMKELYNRHRMALFFWKVLNLPNKLLFHRNDWSLYLQFLCLGHPELSRHCDSIGRFCWEKDTTESDFMQYIHTMQNLAGEKLVLEIDIKE